MSNRAVGIKLSGLDPRMPKRGTSTSVEEIAFLDGSTSQLAHNNVITTAEHSTNKDFVDSPSQSRLFTYVFCLVVGYSSLAILAWIAICTLSHHPFGRTTYGYESFPDPIGHSFEISKRWYRAAIVLQSIVSVLTIPLTSAVCSIAAVTFIQNRAGRGRLTLRQTMVLADRGWTDVTTWIHLITLRGWKKDGSRFVGIATMMILLGAIIAPLQQIFLSTTTIKLPHDLIQMYNQIDMMDHFDNELIWQGLNNNVLVLTRASLADTNLLDPQPQLWNENVTSCDNVRWDDPVSTSICTSAEPILANLDKLKHPFFAQLPSSFTSGIVRQFAPRINSSVTRTIIDASEFPVNCQNIENAFFAQYSSRPNSSDAEPHPTYVLEACMPANLSQSPWKAVRSRQDFSEELYLNITLWPEEQASPVEGTFYHKIVLNTTAAYFELPNYMNQGKPGPLLENDPSSYCGSECLPQTYTTSSSKPYHEVFPPQFLTNRGPLFTLALALFGNDSFIQQRNAHPEWYINMTTRYSDTSAQCIDMAPMQGLLVHGIPYAEPGFSRSFINYCITDSASLVRHIEQQVFDYLVTFLWNDADGQDGATISKAWTAAAFLANKIWMTTPVNYPSLTMSYDLGADTQIPVISTVGIIVVSVLLALFLLSLFAMTIYAVRGPRWIRQLDSLAMMRIGARLAPDLPMDLDKEASDLELLDEKVVLPSDLVKRIERRNVSVSPYVD